MYLIMYIYIHRFLSENLVNIYDRDNRMHAYDIEKKSRIPLHTHVIIAP